MVSQGLKLLWLLTSSIALLVCTASAQGGGGSEAATQTNFGTTLYSSYNFLKCTSDLLVTPTSTREVSSLIKLLTTNHNRVKIRATRPGFHSGAGFVCSGKRDNTKQQFDNQTLPNDGNSRVESVSVLLHLMNRVVSVDSARRRLTVEAGMTILDFGTAAEANNMSVRAGAYSVYANLTLGGIVSASAHGSGLGTISSLGMLVRKIKWVNAKGEVIVSDVETREGAKGVNALVGGLGLLGIITELSFQLEANSRTIVEARANLTDTNIVADLKHILKHETPHVVAFWRPDLGTYRVQLYTHVADGETLPSNAPGFQATGRSAFSAPVDDLVAERLSGLLAAWEGDVADESAAADTLNAGICTTVQNLSLAPLFRNIEGTPIQRATVPTNFAMVGPDCYPKCSFNNKKGFRTEDTEFTIKASQLKDWVHDVKSIIKTELQFVQNRLDKRYGKGKVRGCLQPGEIWFRFGKGTKGLLATSSGTEDVAFVQWSTVVSVLDASTPPKHFTMVQTIEQLSLCKYKARPHWGKNHERVFRHPECHVRDNFPVANIEQVVELQERHDPEKVFEPELFKHVLKKRVPEYFELCTLQYWCYCREDAHCPSRHACQRSPAFPEYKVCRLVE